MPIIRFYNEQGDRNVIYEFNSDERPLGEGGMGRVFKGRRIDRSNGMTRDVAIKVMFEGSPEHVIERARREASIRILNDNLIEMIDFVEVKVKDSHNVVLATHYHVVSEFLSGVNLDELLDGKTFNHDGRPNPTAEMLLDEYHNDRNKFVGHVFRSILSGILALHYAGYIHRDIDPSNIMVTSDGKIKLIDFGIARKMALMGQQERHLTNNGQFVGKPHYAAPELVMGDIAHQDFRTDIYSLGIMLFQLVTGNLPFDGPKHEVIDKQLHKELPLSQVKDKLMKRIIAKATQKKQDKRYQTAAEMLVDIDKWINSNSMVPPKVKNSTKPERIKKELFPKSMVKIVSIAASALLVIGLAFVLINHLNKGGGGSSSGERSYISNYVSGYNVSRLQGGSDNIKLKAMLDTTKNLAKAERWMKYEASASDGFAVLDELVKEGDFEATFLKSRLAFDQKASGRPSDTMFYDNVWETMRINSHIETSDSLAHALLMDAYHINEGDYVMLYHLGCDFMGGRGCQPEPGKARWCFETAKSLEKTTDPALVVLYQSAINKRLEQIGGVPKEKP